MVEVQCQICLKKFRDLSNLRRHQSRATPCTLIVEAKDEGNGCKYCGRQFASKSSMQRHIKQSCKVANSSEGMEALFRHTVQKAEEQNKMILDQKDEISELRCMMKQLAAAQLRSAEIGFAVGATPAPSQVTINTTYNNNTQNIIIQPWHDEGRIVVPASMLRAAFTENPKLVEYCRLNDFQQSDVDDATPYIIEALMDLVKRAHKEPSARNVYLSPNRADQVMVFDEATWKVVPLMSAIRSILDSIATQIHRIVIKEHSKELPAELHGPVYMVSLVYRGDPDKYDDHAKSEMVAHLTNMMPVRQPRLKC